MVSRTRGPASVAQTLYRETEASRAQRERMAEERRSAPFSGGAPEIKPSKRERRALERLRGRG
jgi:ribosome-associated heat shock protein Hsp15